MSLALMRNTGTCRPDAKREAQVASRHKGQSIDAGHRGGDARNVRWAAHESGGFKSLRRLNEGRCIQKRG